MRLFDIHQTYFINKIKCALLGDLGYSATLYKLVLLH